MNTMGARELVSSAECSRGVFVKHHRRRQVAGSRGRQKVIHLSSLHVSAPTSQKRINNAVIGV